MQQSRKQLTGRLDVRTGWFGRQIIRVQEETQTTSYVVNPPPPGRDPKKWAIKVSEEMERSWITVTKEWRDAKPTEVIPVEVKDNTITALIDAFKETP